MSHYENTDKEPTVQEEREQYGTDKPKAKDTARLIWASKPRKEPSAKDLEFQTAEEVYPNIADKETHKLSAYTETAKDISKQPNRLIWGDNLLVMQALLAQGYEGQIDLIYIDPPFNTGENFNFQSEVKIGDETYEKELPVNERLAYSDTWSRGVDSFLDMLYPRLQLMKKLLSDNGTIYIHLGPNISHYVKIIADEIFGVANFRNEIIWKRSNPHGHLDKKFAQIHDVILMYGRAENPIFNVLYTDSDPDYIENFFKQSDERGRYRLVTLTASGSGSARKFIDEIISPPAGCHWRWSQERIDKALDDGIIVISKNKSVHYKQYLEDTKGTPLQSLWTDKEVTNVQASSKERVNYPTQKPESLIERIIKSSSDSGNLVGDFFCGSGTTAAVAERLGRRWVTSDISKTAIQVARGRLVNQNAQPFIIENLGNYQRQLIYAKEVKLKEMYSIVLKLYGARPREDWQGFGISKEDDNKTLVFVCEPDRPMSGKKALELAKFARTADGKGYKKLVILAWDYELDFDDIFKRMMAGKKDVVDVDPRVIPSDVYKYLRTSKSGDQDNEEKNIGLHKPVTFYQKPYMRLGEPEVTSRASDSFGVKVKIDQYVILDIPIRDESKRAEVESVLHKNFAYLIDYWSVDWDYDGEVFRSKWQAIRDRKSGKPVPIVAEATLSKGRKYKIAIRVVDVFGNDASVTKEIKL
jgi:adenine-specific DNA-methyltransferase